MSGVETVVSDFGGVLTTPLEASFRFFSEDSGVPLNLLGEAIAEETRRLGEHPVFRLERGEMTEADFLDGLATQLTGIMARDVDMSGFTDAYFGHLDANEEMLDALARWKAEGLRLALCTNNVREWEPYWRAMLPVDELFEVVVDSAYVGVRKPDTRIYEIVFERLGGVDPSSCVLIDDIAANCQGAGEVGMHAVHFRDAPQAIAAVERLLGRD